MSSAAALCCTVRAYRLRARAHGTDPARAPADGSPLDAPHLQVRDPRAPRWPLRKAHLPTGRVALEDVVALAIELGAKPLRRDWRTVLVQTRAAFHRWRTWA
jgi:hypothetical protein